MVWALESISRARAPALAIDPMSTLHVLWWGYLQMITLAIYKSMYMSWVSCSANDVYFPLIWGLVPGCKGDHRVFLYNSASIFYIVGVPVSVLLFPHEVVRKNLILLVL